MKASVRRSALSITLGVMVTVFGCSSGSANRKPDTGYGAGQTPPATMSCANLCPRLADCGAHLCDEDTNSMNYDALFNLLLPECQSSGCTDALLQMKFTADQWQCVFESSCRQVFDSAYDVCHGMSYYYCH